MSWRTVVVKNRCKLSFKNNYLVVFGDEGEKTIHIDEIGTLIIESTAVSLTAYLLCELSNHKVKVIFCDQKKNPHAEMVPYNGAHNASKRIRAQSNWQQTQKDTVWQHIVWQKISMQVQVLKKVQADESVIQTLEQFAQEVLPGDTSNREAHAARLYFRALFGDRFIRDTGDDIDAALNYGYSLILSNFNREIVAAGYVTSLGVNHVNEFNPFNLACDLMEPFRPIVDLCVYERRVFAFDDFFKSELIKMLEAQVVINNKKQFIPHAIYQYTTAFFRVMETNDLTNMATIQL